MKNQKVVPMFSSQEQERQRARLFWETKITKRVWKELCEDFDGGVDAGFINRNSIHVKNYKDRQWNMLPKHIIEFLVCEVDSENIKELLEDKIVHKQEKKVKSVKCL